jgi:epoxyqueuosine reductase
MGDIARRLGELQSQFRQGRITRRSFLRYAAALGLSVGAAEMLAACAAKPATMPPLSPSSTPGPYPEIPENYVTFGRQNEFRGGDPSAKVMPTLGAPLATHNPVPTPTPVMWEAAEWTCPGCGERFASEGALLEHVRTQHARKIPGARVVAEPTYRQFEVGRLERFDQRNHVFSRMMWDREYQAMMQQVVLRTRRETAEEVLVGRALVAGAIYADDAVGSLSANYRGYSGHLVGVGGLYDWEDGVAEDRLAVDDPGAMSEQIKGVARFYGADLVGICEIDPRWVYSHYYDRETGAYGALELPYRYAIVMGIEMEWAEIRESPGFAASAVTALAYSRMAEVSAKVAKYIRSLGYPAVPSGNDTTQSIPLAIDAGLGELGRLGLLLTPEHGARQRICKVYTDLPMAVDQPIDFGMQRFCELCKICAKNCPVQAIPSGERGTEPTSISNRLGLRRWHVDVAKCRLFWAANGSDCSNCIRACPWSEERRPWI